MRKNTQLFHHRMVKALLLVFIISPLLFTACTQDEEESVAPLSEVDSQQQAFLTLAHNEGDIIMIEGTSGDSEELRATEAAGVDRGRFNITLKFVVPVTERQEQVFNDAAARWERIIIGDVPSFTGTIPSAFGGLPPAVDGTLDDVVIEVALISIDGPGGTLGAAGPRFVRTADFLTLSGVMFFDVADLDFLEQLDLFEEVIVHEMGHVLGVGTLWNVAQFGFDRTLREGEESNPFFNGKKANVFWNAEGGTDKLPVEGDFGPGTRLSHWDESALNNELMTGFLNLGENPLSRITAGSMRDLGYKPASVGESYDLPKGTPGVDPGETAAAEQGEGLHIAEMEELLGPVGFVTIK